MTLRGRGDKVRGWRGLSPYVVRGQLHRIVVVHWIAKLIYFILFVISANWSVSLKWQQWVNWCCAVGWACQFVPRGAAAQRWANISTGCAICRDSRQELFWYVLFVLIYNFSFLRTIIVLNIKGFLNSYMPIQWKTLLLCTR
jgi:hypothetical protein